MVSTIYFNVNSPQVRSPAKFIVTKEGANYRVYNRDGTLSFSTSSFEVAMNDEAFNGLSGTYPEIVDVFGDMTVDDVLLFPDYSNVRFNGRWIAAGGLSKDMIRNANQSSYFRNISLIGIGNAVIDGNGTGVRGIELVAGASISDSRTFGMPDGFLGEGFSVYNTTDDGIYINGAGYSSVNWLKNCSVLSGYGHGVYLLSNADCSVIGGHYDTWGGVTKYGVYINNCGYVTVKDIDYINNGCKIDGSYEIEFNSKLVDVGVDMHGLDIINAYRLKVHHTTFHCTSGLSDNTYNCINASGGSGLKYSHIKDNTFVGYDGSHRWANGYYETDTNCDYNVVHGNINAGNVVACVHSHGVGNDVAHNIA